jgi:hypothetical protein
MIESVMSAKIKGLSLKIKNISERISVGIFTPQKVKMSARGVINHEK